MIEGGFPILLSETATPACRYHFFYYADIISIKINITLKTKNNKENENQK